MAASHPPAAAPIHGRREHRKLTTRRELLAAGRQLFGEQGLYGSRIEDLSRHAGIAKGTLYGYFKNKEELIEAVVTSGFSELLGYAHREAQGARTHAGVVARVARAHLTFFRENPDLMRIFHQVRGLLKFRLPEGRLLRRVLAKYLAGLAHVLALHPPAHDRGALALETATLLFGAVSGIVSTRASLAGAVAWNGRTRATTRALVALVLVFERAAAERSDAMERGRASRVRGSRTGGGPPRPGNARRRRPLRTSLRSRTPRAAARDQGRGARTARTSRSG